MIRAQVIRRPAASETCASAGHRGDIVKSSAWRGHSSGHLVVQFSISIPSKELYTFHRLSKLSEARSKSRPPRHAPSVHRKDRTFATAPSPRSTAQSYPGSDTCEWASPPQAGRITRKELS